MDIFGFKKRRKDRHYDFMNLLKSRSNRYLIDAHTALDMALICRHGDSYTLAELRAVEEELRERRYVNKYGQVDYSKVEI